MITISGVQPPEDPSFWSAVARKTYELKKNSPRTYNYQSIRHLRFEMALRSATVDAALALSQSGIRFASYEKARCNESLWNLTETGGFKIRGDVPPAAGIRDIFVNGSLYATECATATAIVLYKGVLDSIGDAYFNRLFSGLLLYDWQMDDDLRLIKEAGGEAFPGDLRYFNNPDFDKPQWRGENAVKIDDDLYYGHPLGIMPAHMIIAFLNRVRRPGSTVSAYMTEDVYYPDFRYLSQFGPGGRPVFFAKIGRQRIVVSANPQIREYLQGAPNRNG